MKKLNTDWNLGLLYKSEKDPQIELDMKRIESGYFNFEKKYKNKDFTSTPEKLLQAYRDFEKFHEDISNIYPWLYFGLRTDLNSEDNIAGANATKITQRLTEAFNKTEFFKLNIGKIPKNKQSKYLNFPGLKPFKYSLERVFKNSQYYLTESEEQLASLLSQTSYEMWVDSSQRLQNKQVIEFKGKKLTVPEAMGSYGEMPKKDRRDLYEKINQSLKSIADIADAEINAVYNYKKIMDERRGLMKPYSETILGYENDEKNIENLISLITKNFKISHRFYTLHAKLLKEKKITLADRQVKLGEIKRKFDFPSSVEIVRKAFIKVDPKYAEYLDTFIENGQIDVFPKKGKKGGGYCLGIGKLPTFILLNHLDNIRSVETLAHEMGHAIHTELSKSQPAIYRYYSTATAEVASTFFEQLVVEDLENLLSDKEKIILLHNKILGDISSIFRQVACFNFELELHNKIRKDGQVSKGDIADMLSKNMKAYVGPSVEVTHDDGYFFVYWSHIRRFFYVYSYAYGQMISRALYEKWKADPSYAKKIEEFLKAGGSMTPENIFKSIGINTSDPEFFKAALRGIEKDIDRLEKLTKKGFK